MEEIIKPVSKELLKAELTEDKRLRMTNKSNNQIYIITYQNAPNVMREIGRLREIAFRAAGGGTGLSMDIDEYDTMEHPYKQLIVWNPEAEEILGGYRYLLGTDVRFDEKGAPILATSHMFHFSETFIKEYLPQTIELGRSFVTLEYQSTRAGSKGLFALDNLWDGLPSGLARDDAQEQWQRRWTEHEGGGSALLLALALRRPAVQLRRVLRWQASLRPDTQRAGVRSLRLLAAWHRQPLVRWRLLSAAVQDSYRRARGDNALRSVHIQPEDTHLA